MQLPAHSQYPGLNMLAEFLTLPGLLRGHLLQAHLEFGRTSAWGCWRRDVDYGRGYGLHAFAHSLLQLFRADGPSAWRGRRASPTAAHHMHDGRLLWRLSADDLGEAVLALA